MVLDEQEVNLRLESPLNLINKLNKLTGKTLNGMELFVPSRLPSERHDAIPAVNPTPECDDLTEVIDEKKIKLGIVRSKAIDVLHDSLHSLHCRLGEVDKVRDLSSIASDMKKIISEDGQESRVPQQVIVYKPVINDISKYDTLVVHE